MKSRNLARKATLVVLVALLSSSCAYYNTFYQARRYYNLGTGGEPYVVDKPDAGAVGNFGKSVDYSKRLLGSYPNSKWVDDAYLLWARALIGKDDPIETVNMLRDFSTRYPQSPLQPEALFYFGVGSRKARMYNEALSAFDDFLKKSPKHELAPYALLERATVLLALERPGEAATSAGAVLERFPKSKLVTRALLLRAQSLLAQGENDKARADYHLLGDRATTDDDRFTFLLKEAECLEAGHRYDDELSLLQSAAGHEQEPEKNGGGGGTQPVFGGPTTPSNERWGRLMLRIGAVEMLAGRTDRALEIFRRVVDEFPRTPIAAEGQYRIAYTYETSADDFERARTEYGKVQAQAPSSQFATQAALRLSSLDRLAQYRSGAGADSVGKKAEAAFLLAEQYLFQLDKPDRALEQYRAIAHDFAGAYAGKALNAQAWVLRNKYDQPQAADSILWAVVRNYPKTEAQMNARDYLERFGQQVPDSLIQPPDTTRLGTEGSMPLTPPPARVDSIGIRRRATALDSLLRFEVIRAGDAPPSLIGPTPPRPASPDSGRAVAPVAPAQGPARRDTTRSRP